VDANEALPGGPAARREAAGMIHLEDSVTSDAGLSLEAQAGVFAVAKKQWPLSARQRQASSRGAGRRLEANTAKVSAQYCNRMVVDAADRGDVEEALMRMNKLRADGLKPNCEAFNALLLELIRCNQVDEAEDWLGKASTSALYPEFAGLEVSVSIYIGLVASFAGGGQLPKAEKYAREAQGRGLEMDSSAYQTLVQACLDVGECRRAHAWCLEMVNVGHRKPTKALMKSLVWALTDAGNTMSANHWLKFMAEESSDLDNKTYEHLRSAHPLDIVPTGLSGEVGASVPPVVRPATVGGERRQAEQAKASPKVGAGSHESPRPAWLSSPRRTLQGMKLKPLSTAQLSPKTGGPQAIGGQTKLATERWLADMGTGEAWLGRKGLGPVASATQ